MQKVYEGIFNEPTKEWTSSTVKHAYHVFAFLLTPHIHTMTLVTLLYQHSQPRGKQGLNVNLERKSHVRFPKPDSTGIPRVGKFMAHVEGLVVLRVGPGWYQVLLRLRQATPK